MTTATLGYMLLAAIGGYICGLMLDRLDAATGGHMRSRRAEMLRRIGGDL